MEGSRLLQTICLRNILSYGPEPTPLTLEPLNVFIGPNASGKSNLIEALAVLRAAPTDVQAPIRTGGGVTDWVWKGEPVPPTASIEVTMANPFHRSPLLYQISFKESLGRFRLVHEGVAREDSSADADVIYRNIDGKILLKRAGAPLAENVPIEMKEQFRHDESILSQLRDAYAFPEITYLSLQFQSFAFYREWNLGRNTTLRYPQKADLPDWVLLEDSSNLGMILNDLENRPNLKGVLLSHLQRLYRRVTNITTKIRGGTVQVYFHEEGLQQPIPATRLSDGTLRYLCLLTILCHPEPPPVVCIEEPELGLHPDVIPVVADLLVDASTRTQLFVTTHSGLLVDSLSDHPEAIVICERGVNGSELRRLQPDRLNDWLERYRLGELWQMGEIGGNPK